MAFEKGIFLTVLFLRYRPDLNRVRFRNLQRFSVHHNNIFLIIYRENCNCIACMVRNSQMLIIREKHDIFRILTTDRKCKLSGEHTGFFISFKHGNRIFSCCCAEQMLSVISQRQSGSSAVCVMRVFLLTCLNTLDQLKLRCLSTSIILIRLDLITEFKKNISKFTIITETNDTRPLSLGHLKISTSSSLFLCLLIR